MKSKFIWLLLIITVITACGQNPFSNDEPVAQPTTPAPTTPPNPRVVDTPTPSLPPTWTPGSAQNVQVNSNNNANTNGNNANNLPGVAVRTTYTIQAGDSLGAIAVEFNIPLDLLIQANNIEDPDHIEIGTVLIIPEE